jgi:hypothetical protein
MYQLEDYRISICSHIALQLQDELSTLLQHQVHILSVLCVYMCRVFHKHLLKRNKYSIVNEINLDY